MEDPDSNLNMAPPPRPVRRVDLGVRSIIQIVLAALAVIFIFYLAMTYYTRKDLTANSTFTLSETSQNLLKSELLTSREKPVRIVAALRKTSPHFSRLRPIIEEYERLSDGKIKVEHLDPIRDKNRAAEIRDNYNKILEGDLFEDDLFIIDARDGIEADEDSTDSLKSHLRYLRAQDLLVSRTDEQKQRRVVGYQDEDMLSSAIQAAVEGDPRIMYLIEDKSDVEVGAAKSPWLVLTEALERQNILLLPIKISQVDKIPENAEGVVLLSPEYDFEPKEIEVLQNYWSSPSAAMIAYLSPTKETLNLRAFFRRLGITPRDDRVIRTRNGRTERQVLATFTGRGLNIHGSLESKSVRFEGRVGSLEVREGASDLEKNGIKCYSIIQTADGFWGETDYRESNPEYDDEADEAGPLAIGAAVIDGNANDDLTAPDVSKMIVLSTSDFLDPKSLGNEQLDFVSNSTNWLLGRDELIGIGPRAIEFRKLNLIPSEVSMLHNIIVFFIPAGLFLISMIVWSTRRA